MAAYGGGRGARKGVEVFRPASRKKESSSAHRNPSQPTTHNPHPPTHRSRGPEDGIFGWPSRRTGGKASARVRPQPTKLPIQRFLSSRAALPHLSRSLLLFSFFFFHTPVLPHPPTCHPMSERGNFRGRGGGARGGNANRGAGGNRGGSAQGGEKPKKENILDLNKYMDKEITVKFNGGREGVFVGRGWKLISWLVWQGKLILVHS